MSAGAARAALFILVLGVLVVWLARPIGDACPDLGRLPPGSSASSKPSLTPPLTRMCTYTTPDGTNARKRYVPLLDWLVLGVVAGIAGIAITRLGPQPPQPRAQRRPRERERWE